jgi:hypothetical protein
MVLECENKIGIMDYWHCSWQFYVTNSIFFCFIFKQNKKQFYDVIDKFQYTFYDLLSFSLNLNCAALLCVRCISSNEITEIGSERTRVLRDSPESRKIFGTGQTGSGQFEKKRCPEIFK